MPSETPRDGIPVSSQPARVACHEDAQHSNNIASQGESTASFAAADVYIRILCTLLSQAELAGFLVASTP